MISSPASSLNNSNRFLLLSFPTFFLATICFIYSFIDNFLTSLQIASHKCSGTPFDTYSAPGGTAFTDIGQFLRADLLRIVEAEKRALDCAYRGMQRIWED